MFRKMWQKSDNHAKLLSRESSISLEVYSFDDKHHEKPLEETREEKPQFLASSKIYPKVWMTILDFCNTTEAVNLGLALGKSGKSLLQNYVSSNEDLLLHGYFPLSKPNAFSLQGKLRNVLHTETKRLEKKEEKKKSITIKAISCLSLLTYGAYFEVFRQGYLLTKPADQLYPYVEIYYNKMKQTCTNVFEHTSVCTVIQDLPCSGERCKTYDCDIYDPYMYKCDSPPAHVNPYTTSLLDKLSSCSPSLFANYTEICANVNAINGLATPYYWGAAGIFVAATLLAYGACSWQFDIYSSDKPKLTIQFSPSVSLTKKEDLSYKQLINFLEAKELKVEEVLEKIETFIGASPSEYQKCLFFKRPSQPKKAIAAKTENNINYIQSGKSTNTLSA